VAKIAAGAAATVPAVPCATSASRWPHGGWIEIVHGKDVGVSSRFLAELVQQPGASIRISGGVTLISSEVWFCCPLWADRKGLQWRLVLPHSASAFPQRLLQTGQSAPVKSFGRRLAFESLRRTNPRDGCSRYGDLGVRLGWKDQPRAGDRPSTMALHLSGQVLHIECRCDIPAEVRGCKLFPRAMVVGHRRPQQGCDFATVHAVPGHDELRPGEHTGRGGARGWA